MFMPKKARPLRINIGMGWGSREGMRASSTKECFDLNAFKIKWADLALSGIRREQGHSSRPMALALVELFSYRRWNFLDPTRHPGFG